MYKIQKFIYFELFSNTVFINNLHPIHGAKESAPKPQKRGKSRKRKNFISHFAAKIMGEVTQQRHHIVADITPKVITHKGTL